MKIIKFIKKEGKVYIARVRITDHDIDIMEDLAYCITGIDDMKNKDNKYNKWLRRNFWELQRLWKKYDKREVTDGM